MPCKVQPAKVSACSHEHSLPSLAACEQRPCQLLHTHTLPVFLGPEAVQDVVFPLADSSGPQRLVTPKSTFSVVSPVGIANVSSLRALCHEAPNQRVKISRRNPKVTWSGGRDVCFHVWKEEGEESRPTR